MPVIEAEPGSILMISEDYIQLGNVRVGKAGAVEMDGHRPLLSVPRADIMQLEAVYTVAGERPAVTLIVGMALLIVSVVPILALVDVLQRGGTYDVEWIGAVACLIPAVWLIQLSVRRRWILLVRTTHDRRKLVFPKQVTQTEVESFIAQAKSRFGYR